MTLFDFASDLTAQGYITLVVFKNENYDEELLTIDIETEDLHESIYEANDAWNEYIGIDSGEEDEKKEELRDAIENFDVLFVYASPNGRLRIELNCDCIGE